MKSFAQKMKEKAERLEAERLIAEAKAEEARKWEEWHQAREEEKRQLAESQRSLDQQRELEAERYQQHIEKRRQEEELRKAKEQSIFEKKINYEKDRINKDVFRKKQKQSINEILNSEKDFRKEIESQRSQQEIIAYEEAQLQKIQEADDMLAAREEQRLNEIKLQKEQEALELEKQKKYQLQEESEKQKQKEMRLLREEQAKEAEEEAQKRLDEILAERQIFEERQIEIANQTKQKRIEVNKILSEAQQVLDSSKNSDYKARLAGLQNYIYRINPTQEYDPWTNRKQPISVLTWEEWKIIPDNEKLIEENFKRAKMLFEQDNMRAQMYHDYMWHWSPPNPLSDQSSGKSIDEKDTLTDIPYEDLVKRYTAKVLDIGDINHWLDATQTSYISTATSHSIATDLNKLHIYFSNNEAQDETGLTVTNKANLLDGSKDTFMRITNNSSSAAGQYYWPYTASIDGKDGNNAVDRGDNDSDILTLEYRFGTDDPQRVQGIELVATNRRAMPLVWDVDYARSNSTEFNDRIELTVLTETLALDENAQNNERFTLGESFHGKFGADANGGRFGVTPEGSASLDSYYLQFNRNDGKYDRDKISAIRFAFKVFTTGSHVDLHQLNIWQQTTGSDPIQHGQTISHWASYTDKKEFIRPNMETQRQIPIGYPTWNSGSNVTSFQGARPPIGTGADLNMPYVQFSSESRAVLIGRDDGTQTGSIFDTNDGSEFTHFIVARENSGKTNLANFLYANEGLDIRENYNFYGGQFYRAPHVRLWDKEIGISSPSQIEINLKGLNNTNLQDIAENKGWPHVGDGPQDSLTSRNIVGRKARIYCVRFKKFRPDYGPILDFWIDGGVAFRNDEAFNEHYAQNDYVTTGSKAPTYGGSEVQYLASVRQGNPGYFKDSFPANLGNWQLHEAIKFDKALSHNEITTVASYLSEKWRIPIDELIDSEVTSSVVTAGSGSDEGFVIEQNTIDTSRPNAALGTFTY